MTHSIARTGINGGLGLVTARNSAYDHATVLETGAGSLDHAQANLDLATPGFLDPSTGDYHLAPGSPLRDAGDPAPAGGLASTDLGGNTRSLDGNGDGIVAPDIGAFEFQPPAVPTPPPATPPGRATDPPATQPDLAPVITSASVTHRRFSIGSARTAVAARATRGTTFRLTLSENAQVKITIRRAGRTAATLTRSSHLGANRIAFSGRIGRRVLRPGRYVATLSATDASGKRSAPRTLRFAVLKG
jgi:hypothetical protein